MKKLLLLSVLLLPACTAEEARGFGNAAKAEAKAKFPELLDKIARNPNPANAGWSLAEYAIAIATAGVAGAGGRYAYKKRKRAAKAAAEPAEAPKPEEPQP